MLISRRTFMLGVLGAGCVLSSRPCFASIAQGIVAPLTDDQLNASFAGLCAGAGQLLAGRLSPNDLQAALTKARVLHARLLPLPDIGGPDNLVYSSFVVGPQYVALYKALSPYGVTAKEVGKLVYDLAAHSYAQQAPTLKANGERLFSPGYYAILRAWAERSRRKRYPMDWVQTVFRGDGTDYDLGIDYTECGLMKYFAAQGVPELAAYPCYVDFPASRAEGTGLYRTTTLAWGGEVCNFRYRKGRAVTQGWDKA
ncbi:L-2-amino-thiazoline-4-carboxylic acid hydrolase [Pseudodesulfovibrio karagichevae]|uniref:L-2-amino-thiazoline-4-carboxylic acid hydrolase n=1 Tax=Pseudodesulfovibrio karagichevae TaxID=3239305 RepID=A0ABV4JXV9_9BACT